MKRLTSIKKILDETELTTKISLYFSTKSVGADFDPEESNYTYTNLNPLTLKGLVREINAESLVWRQMGTQEVGAKEIICDEKYGDWFRRCNKVVIDGDIYHVYKEHVGNRVLIQKRPYHLIKVIVSRNN